MNKIVVSVAIQLVAVSAYAVTSVVLKSSLSGTSFSWQSGESYVGGIAPSAGEEVVVPDGMTAKLPWTEADHADFDFVSELLNVRVEDDAKLEIDVPDDKSATLGCGVSQWGHGTKMNGELVKTGAGELTLGAMAKQKMSATIFMDYYSWIRVKAGTLRLPRTCSNDSAQLRYRRVTVDEDATLFTPDYGCAYFWGGLAGKGLVTNACVATDAKGLALRNLYFYSTSLDTDIGRFEGRLTGPHQISAESRFDLLGTNSVNTGTLILNDGSSVGIATFGAKASVPSSYGTGNPNFNKKSEIRYLGVGETSARNMWIGYDTTIDAGAGKLVFTGYWGSNGSQTNIRRLTLTGTNETHEAVLSNQLAFTTGDYSYVIRKQGAGVWRLAPIASRDWRGLLTVEEGTLRFDTIAEAGVNCALGYSTILLNDVVGGTASENKVPYAFRLGGWDANEQPTEGLLEYVGTDLGFALTRPLAIRSCGGVKASVSPLCLSGFTAEDAGEKTLVLDGDLADENVACNVTNGPGTVSIVKRGAGTWYLDGIRDFSGDVSVESGTLVARQPKSTFSWYRFTIRETGFAHGGGLPLDVTDYERTGVAINELALYDANGAQVNLNAAVVPDWRCLKPGQAAMGRADLNSAVTNELFQLFDNTGMRWFAHLPSVPTEEDESTHVPIVFRLPSDSTGAARFDFYYSLLAGGDYSARQPTSVKLEGSVDGVNWESLFATNGIAYPTKSSWISDGATSIYQPWKDKGFPLVTSSGNAALTATHALGNARSVSVARGATLKSEGGAATISKYVLDAAGGGRLEGFAFADTGVLEIRNLPRGQVLDIPVDFTAAEGWDKMNGDGWTVSTPGVKSARSVTVSATGVQVVPPGLMMIIR